MLSDARHEEHLRLGDFTRDGGSSVQCMSILVLLDTSQTRVGPWFILVTVAGLVSLGWLAFVLTRTAFVKNSRLQPNNRPPSTPRPPLQVEAGDEAAMRRPPGNTSVPSPREVGAGGRLGPEERLALALEQDPSGCEKLDLTANWDSYYAEPKLTRLPARIREFTRLKSLVLLWNELKNLPAEVAQLQPLEELVLTCNPLTALPGELRRLLSLRWLDAERCGLQSLPEWLGELRNLERLNASDNRIHGLPDSLAALARLKHLDLSQNALQDLPDFREVFPCLVRLNLSRNRLRLVPEWVVGLPLLTELNLADNKLVSLPETVRSRSELLSTLQLQANALTVWPQWLSRLTALEVLHFGPTAPFEGTGNRLRALPESVRELEKLKVLSLSLAPGADVSEALGELPNLTELRLDAARFPTVVATLGTLRSLAVSGLAEETKPLEGQWPRLNRLEHLDLSARSAALIPDGLIALGSLKSVTLRCRKVAKYQLDRLARIKSPGCHIEIKLEGTDRTIRL